MDFFTRKPKLVAEPQPSLNQKIDMHEKSKVKFNEAYTITFSERVENHAGMQKIGIDVKDGFSLAELEKAKKWFESKGVKAEIIDLRDYLPENEEYECDDACILIARNGLDVVLKNHTTDELFIEQRELTKDVKVYMRGQVKNKIARHNLCFADFDQEADYEKGKGTIIDFKHLPALAEVRSFIPETVGEKGRDLFAEGNYYYDTKKCGIGFHGDGERRRIWAVKLGESIPLHYQWFKELKPIGKRAEFMFGHGDIYIMAQKAVGTDWKRRKVITLRHAAGCKKYLTIK